jgi:hypothetical protein
MLFQKGLQPNTGLTQYAQGSQISSMMHLDLFHLPLEFWKFTPFLFEIQCYVEIFHLILIFIPERVYSG